jgi:hypothetical protein
VLHIDREQACSWSTREVVERWLTLFSGPPLMHRFVDGELLTAAELDAVEQWTETWRQRLHDLSWFMRCLNESVARMANDEDGCSGRFWEGRFRSQALLDERALLACMAYVDLNPIRAGIARTPEHSDFTSIKQRIDHPDDAALWRFRGNADEHGLPFTLRDYLELVDWAGRTIRTDKKGFIPTDVPPILARLAMDPEALAGYVRNKPDRQFTAIGPITRLRRMARSMGLKFIKGVSLSQRLCPQSG